jgi:recombination protein RecT
MGKKQEKQEELLGDKGEKAPMESTTLPAVAEKAAATAIAPFQQNVPLATQEALKGFLHRDNVNAALATVVPKHLTAERIVKMALTAASRNPRILQCTQGSILRSVMEAGALGLDCSGLLGRGYLVPYKNYRLTKEAGRDIYEAQFQAGYQGLIDLARRSNTVSAIEVHEVYQQDDFDIQLGTEPRIHHKPYLGADRKGVTCEKGQVVGKENLKCFYGIAWLKDGGKQQIVMTLADIERHRLRSKSADDGPWVTDYVPMGKKTVARQLCKFLPASPELEAALIHESAIDAQYSQVPTVPALPNVLEPTGGERRKVD